MKVSGENFKVSYADNSARFFVNEEKRTVACELTGALLIPGNVGIFFDWPFDRDVTVTAVARCSKNDTFDVNRGKRIALAKAENKIYLQSLRLINEASKGAEDLLSARDRFTEKAYACCAHNEEYIDSVSYPQHPNYKATVTEPKRGRE